MAVEPRRFDFNEFANNLGAIFDSLKREGQPVLVDREGDLYKLEPQGATGRRPLEALQRRQGPQSAPSQRRSPPRRQP